MPLNEKVDKWLDLILSSSMNGRHQITKEKQGYALFNIECLISTCHHSSGNIGCIDW